MTNTNLSENSPNPDSTEMLYTPDVFSLKKHMGEKFTPEFIKSFELKGLVDKIKNITETSKQKNNRTPIISFCSEKGGSGKTTTALCAMQVVANLGFKVLLIDVDPTRGSSAVVNARKALITADMEAAQQQGIDVEEVLKFKMNSEPVIDALEVAPKNFNAAVVQEIAEKKDYDLIVIDTAGVKSDDAANFDIRQVSSSGKPHITAGYVSNLVVVPTSTSNIDLDKMIAFAQPLMVFIGTLKMVKLGIINTQYRVLANRVEKQGSGLKELESAKEEVLLNWFEGSIRRSEKIAANTSTKHSATIFSTKTVKQINESYISIVDEMYSDIETSLEN